MTVNRYKQLLASIPKGTFYASDGQVLPFRDSPYQFRMSTGVATREYAIYVNENSRGSITSDAAGVALLSILLVKGDNYIKLVDSQTGALTSAHVTTRDYATALAAVAESIETIDTGVEQVLDDARLQTSSAGLIEDVFGKTVSTTNDPNYTLDVYRELLQELRAAYRYYGATIEGMSRVTRAYTQISPLIYPAAFGTAWILGKDFIFPSTDTTDRVSYVSVNAALVASQGTGAGMTITSLGSDVFAAVSDFNIDGTASPKKIRWRSNFSGWGQFVNVAANGTYTLYDGEQTPEIIGLAQPYNIVTGANDKLSLEFGGLGVLTITLTAGAARTAAQIATDINTALAADLRYGATYNSVAFTTTLGGSTNLALRSGNAGANVATVTVHPTNNTAEATQTLFNLPAVRGGLQGAHLAGATTLNLAASTDMTLWPLATVDDPISIIVGRATFHPVGAPNAAATLTSAEVVAVTAVDRVTKTLTLATGLVNNQPALGLVELSGQMSYIRQPLVNKRAIVVRVTNYTALPGSNITEAFTVSSVGLPQGWILTNNAGSPITNAAPSKYEYFEIDRDVPFVLASDSMVSIPLPDELLKYKGFKMQLSVWGSFYNPTYATPIVDIAQLGMSFNNQTSYTMTSPTVSGSMVSALNKPREYAVQMIVPPTSTKIWARMKLTANTGTFVVHKVRVTVPGAHGGLFMGDGTTPRNESKVKQGLLTYVWCKDILATQENAQLGLLSTTQNQLGHIDTIAPASSWLDKFNVSEYSGSEAVNAMGAFTDADFLAGTSINLDLILRTPSRFTYLRPNIVNSQAEIAQFAVNSPHTYTLAFNSDQDQSQAVLFENGVPLFKDEWQFNNTNTIELLSLPNTTSVYEIRYNALIRFTSAAVDLGANFADHLWFADGHIWLRPEIVATEVVINTGLQFDATGVATLAEQSNQDQPTATLLEETGLSRQNIAVGNWSFLDGHRVQINQNIFNPSAVYSLTYTALVNHPAVQANATLEFRYGVSTGVLSAASWTIVKPNQVMGNDYRYYQMRVTLNNIRDTRDVRIQSLLVKGLGLFGVGLQVPVLRP